jgi:hypothetical protein
MAPVISRFGAVHSCLITTWGPNSRGSYQDPCPGTSRRDVSGDRRSSWPWTAKDKIRPASADRAARKTAAKYSSLNTLTPSTAHETSPIGTPV